MRWAVLEGTLSKPRKAATNFHSREEDYMKRSIILAMVVSFMIISFGASAVFAAEAKTQAGQTQLQGVLELSGTDYVIKSGNTTYTLIGDKLADFVGKKVIANGKMTKTDKGKVLQVEKIYEDISKKK
jgi:peptidoglycan hydrolase CwlO-like protein